MVDVSVKPHGLHSWEASIELKATELRRWGTWNVRSLTPEKLVIVEKTMIDKRLEIIGISELHWISCGHMMT
jgi:hypothetical protein